ncbi:MAG: hypothetical protein IPG90_04245 [Bacteroidetes bacterium]|nr:hypothetical protein [Bacteroidota bacterium]
MFRRFLMVSCNGGYSHPKSGRQIGHHGSSELGNTMKTGKVQHTSSIRKATVTSCAILVSTPPEAMGYEECLGGE